jgi:hypothetical protein
VPNVHWYRDNVLIDSTASTVDDSVVRNELMIKNIKRNDLNSIFSCKAINNNSTPPISTFVRFDIYGELFIKAHTFCTFQLNARIR